MIILKHVSKIKHACSEAYHNLLHVYITLTPVIFKNNQVEATEVAFHVQFESDQLLMWTIDGLRMSK